MSSDHRRLCILQAVRSLFSKKGLRVTSKELSCAAGVSEALIYKLFSSKEGLYAALLEHSCNAHEPLGQELAEHPPSTEVLACAVYLLIHIKFHGLPDCPDNMSLNPDEVRGLLLQSFQKDGEFARTIFNKGLGPWVSAITQSMETSIKAGEMTPPSEVSLETLVWLIHHSALGVKMTLHPKPDAYMGPKLSEDEQLMTLFKFLLRGAGVSEEALTRVIKSNEFKNFKTKLKPYTKEKEA